jgi:DnaJ-class molecular chaperone
MENRCGRVCPDCNGRGRKIVQQRGALAENSILQWRACAHCDGTGTLGEEWPSLIDVVGRTRGLVDGWSEVA